MQQLTAPVTSVPGDVLPSSGLHGLLCTHVHTSTRLHTTGEPKDWRVLTPVPATDTGLQSPRVTGTNLPWSASKKQVREDTGQTNNIKIASSPVTHEFPEGKKIGLLVFSVLSQERKQIFRDVLGLVIQSNFLKVTFRNGAF